MAYDNGNTITYTTGAITTTAAAATLPLRGPKGMQGRVVDIIARCTTTHVLGTTPTALTVGLAGTLDAYATFKPVAMTAPTATTLTDSTVATSAIVPGHVIPANTVVLLTTVANVTGAPAGVITYDVVISWS